jgi:NADH-quinone oxidoreductase subunit J
MTLGETLFWILAVVAVGSSAMILFSRGIVHMAFWLLASLAGFAGLYLHLGADFLGFTQVVVYIGGILILFLFGVMLTYSSDVPVRRQIPWRLLVPGILAGAAVMAFSVFLAAGSPWQEKLPGEIARLEPLPAAEGSAAAAAPRAEPTSAAIGERFLSTYILPFEVVSLLLLVAMVGASYIARSREESAGGRRP